MSAAEAEKLRKEREHEAMLHSTTSNRWGKSIDQICTLWFTSIHQA